MNKRQIKRQARELIKSAMRDLRTAEVYDDLDGNKVKSEFLGTVFYIMPSGKYYQPFACSNVDVCGRCKGDGCDYCGGLGSREAYEDSLMDEYLQEYANKAGAWVESGEGDPCDLFLVMAVESAEE